MSKFRVPTAALLVLQVLAFIIYPLTYFQRAPQAAVLPPALFLLFVLALVGVNTGTLSLDGTRSLLIFVQGINVVVRVMALFPNLKASDGRWDWALLIAQLIGSALSWYLMVALENRPLQDLKLQRKQVAAE